jgi:ParB family chromosome partitioning protein
LLFHRDFGAKMFALDLDEEQEGWTDKDVDQDDPQDIDVAADEEHDQDFDQKAAA